ncbi:hypothetical protein SLS60_003642 [Paraconiothyrium brasiliense]|uniref:Uncharacterized protein n=1 Tax=Paraconiothyrium brasiliense TaxID=300254 RepID=A0ABR3RP98_9PLEO
MYNPRDKVFGLLGLCSPSEGGWHGRLTVDYAKTTQDVYTRAVAAVLDAGDLSIYHFVPLQPNKNATYGSVNRLDGTQGLPSWVPDFARECASSIYSPAKTDLCHLPWFLQGERLVRNIKNCERAPKGLSRPTLHFSPDTTILYSKGLCLGAITSASLVTLTPETPINVISTVFEIYRTLAKDHDVDAASFLSLAAESDCNTKQHADMIQELLEPSEYLHLLLETMSANGQEPQDSTLYNLACNILSVCLDETIFVTDYGRLGRIYYHDPNDSVKIGDIVVGLFGVNLPFVLRPNENGTYRILNLAFILDHECKHDFLHNVGEGATWEEFERYGIKEYAIV